MSLRPKALLWRAAARLKMLSQRQWPAWRRFKAALNRRSVTQIATSRRVIILAWEFPPHVSGGVYRPLSFARHAAASGWRVDVVCGPSPDLLSEAGRYLAGLLPYTANVTRVADDNGPHPWPLPRIDGGILNALSLFEIALARINTDQGGFVLASGPPFASFVAGLWLARHTGWKLILDYRDEWTQNPHGFKRASQTNFAWERRCLAAAELVLFTTQSQIEHQLREFKELRREKCRVVYNGWEPDDFPLGQERNHNTTSPIEISFFGNLGPWWKIELFLGAMAMLFDTNPELRERFTISFTGDMPQSTAKVLDEFSKRYPLKRREPVPKDQACAMMRETNILLLPNPRLLNRYIPGKIYEYVAADRPILVFGAGGEMAVIVEELDAGRVVSCDNLESLIQALEYLPRHQSARGELKKAWLQSRTRQVQAKSLLDTLAKKIE